MNKGIEYLKLLWSDQWKTKYGLTVTSILLASALYGVSFATIKLLKAHDNTALILLCAITIPLFINLIVWCFCSGRVPIANSKFNVVFCLTGKDLKDDGKSDKYIQNAISIVAAELDKLGLSRKIKLKTIGQDIIKTQDVAEDHLIKHGIDLIVWGHVLYGSKEEQDVCDFTKISFTYKSPSRETNANLAEIFENNVKMALVKRDWNIYEINSITDIEKISENFNEIIMFILGIIYCHHHDYIEDSAKILENLFKILEKQTTGEKIKVDEKKKTLEMSASTLRKGHLLPILCDIYKRLGGICGHKGDYKKSFFYLNKFMNYKTNDIEVLCSLAFCSYHLGNIMDAEKYTDKIKQVDKHYKLYFFNKAFFSILKGKYKGALSLYKKSIKGKGVINSSVTLQVIDFLDQRKKENPQELAYDFAISFINYHLSDKKVGISELRRFAKKAKGKTKYSEMVSYANQLLSSRK